MRTSLAEMENYSRSPTHERSTRRSCEARPAARTAENSVNNTTWQRGYQPERNNKKYKSSFSEIPLEVTRPRQAEPPSPGGAATGRAGREAEGLRRLPPLPPGRALRSPASPPPAPGTAAALPPEGTGRLTAPGPTAASQARDRRAASPLSLPPHGLPATAEGWRRGLAQPASARAKLLPAAGAARRSPFPAVRKADPTRRFSNSRAPVPPAPAVVVPAKLLADPGRATAAPSWRPARPLPVPGRTPRPLRALLPARVGRARGGRPSLSQAFAILGGPAAGEGTSFLITQLLRLLLRRTFSRVPVSGGGSLRQPPAS